MYRWQLKNAVEAHPVVDLCRRLLPYVSDQHERFLAVINNHETVACRLKLRSMLFDIGGNKGVFLRIGDDAVAYTKDVNVKSRRLWNYRKEAKKSCEDMELLENELSEAKYARDVSKFRHRNDILANHIRDMLDDGAYVYK